MTLFLVVASVVVAVGAAIAVGAREARVATLGVALALAAGPFVADPLPDQAALAFRVVAGILAAFLILVAARRAPAPAGSPLGLPAILAASATGFAAGAGATAAALPAAGTSLAVAAGLAALAVALVPVALARDAFRLGSGLAVLAAGALMIRTGLSGTPGVLELLVEGVALVALGAAVAALVGNAVAATGGLAIPEAAIRRRAAEPER